MKKQILLATVSVTALLVGSTYLSVRPLPERLPPVSQDEQGTSHRAQVRDRHGRPLSFTLTSPWNIHDQVPLHQMPPLLRRAFLEAEDKRFFEHHGVDWWARLHAAWQNLRSLRVVRGASTISEQVVRILHPRPRSLWARWIEGLEARQLERRFSKGEILDFYLNQVPFSARRRGVAQAARYFWDRDLETLSEREQLALAVIVRAPERFDLHRNPNGISARIATLSDRMRDIGALNQEQHTLIATQSFEPRRGTLPVRADHFVRFVRQRGYDEADSDRARVRTTLDGALQERAQEILDARVGDLRGEHVTDGALLVIDNTDASIVAWVNAGEFSTENGSQIDAVITPRQPGSTLKPLLYSLALTRGWTAATRIDDAPLSQAVGAGLHSYRNYSRVYYGEIPLRAALGNSLNVPAIKTVQFTGTRDFLEFLRGGGVESLTQPPEHYGEGLALGNGEVTLYELTQAYAALANRGVWRPLRYTLGDSKSERGSSPRALVSPEVASVIGDILADPQARRFEFGSDGLLRFPVETAVKTGTSTDYRDAWAVGYSARYTVGVWMGNLNRSSMREISGARGPALVLRSVFAELERGGESRGLFRSPRLLHRETCGVSGALAGHDCPRIHELFVAGTEPTSKCEHSHTTHSTFDEQHDVARARLSEREVKASQSDEPTLSIMMPTPGLHIARDPRIPDNAERLVFEVERLEPQDTLEWIVDGIVVGHSERGKRTYPWALMPGRHLVRARIVGNEGYRESQEVGFLVR